ncbi:allophanate hydrolase subunit 1 [Streptomyces sp. DG2A-72]|uniref:5-oxoprolinase subunit B family protein n=1 Tax=Streptomyces sp. DG2A-72 TaxID=3051386 RepID=UPI00265BB28D|nr:allophanate hydrolase subunit 1 [Streptomyces sp. DG2A-72]MDO0936762.1 allophanate hydrolase subunit 1 [Streptomyces sp. DG2A-72]
MTVVRPVLRRAGDRGWLVECAGRRPAEVARAIRAKGWASGLREVIPAADTVLVVAERGAGSKGTLGMQRLASELRALLTELSTGWATASAAAPRTVVIPVRYDGPDLGSVAERAGMASAEVARRHADAEHSVAFFGFAPGFAYLDGVPESLRLPRLSSPRERVDAGIVAIAGNQTVVYPGGTPGGWHQIGTTTARLWDVRNEPPNRLQLGDRVVFQEVAS